MELKYWNRVLSPAKEVSMLILDSNNVLPIPSYFILVFNKGPFPAFCSQLFPSANDHMAEHVCRNLTFHSSEIPSYEPRSVVPFS